MPRALGGRDRPEPDDFRVPAFVQPDAKAEASTEHFLMYGYKVIPCSKRYRHDWSVCPFAHNGEMAARRDPRLYQPMFCYHSKQRLPCPRGDACPYAHNLFEYWLHPARYRTEMCQFGVGCTRPVCFFAHGEGQRRVTGIAGGPQPVVAPPEPLMVEPQGTGSGSSDPLVLANIQKAALEQLHMQQTHSDVLPLLNSQSITAAAAAAGLGGGGMTAPLPPPFNVPSSTNSGYGSLPNCTSGLSPLDAMSLLSGSVTSNPLVLDPLSMGGNGGMNGGAGGGADGVPTSELVSQLLASAQQQQQQAAQAASTANLLEELSRQLTTLQMSQGGSHSAPLPNLDPKVVEAATAVARMNSDVASLTALLSGGAPGGLAHQGSGIPMDQLGVDGGYVGRPGGQSSPQSSPLPELFSLQHAWGTSTTSGIYKPAEQLVPAPASNGPSVPISSGSNSKMKPWSAPASPTTALEEGDQVPLASMASISFTASRSTPSYGDNLDQQPSQQQRQRQQQQQQQRWGSHSLPLQQLLSMQALGGTLGAPAGLPEGSEGIKLGPEPASPGGMPRSGSVKSMDDVMAPLMVIGDAPVRADQIRNKVLGAPAGVASTSTGHRNSMSGGAKSSSGPLPTPNQGGDASRGRSEKGLDQEGSLGVEAAAKLLGSMPESSVKQLLEMMKAQHPQLA